MKPHSQAKTKTSWFASLFDPTKRRFWLTIFLAPLAVVILGNYHRKHIEDQVSEPASSTGEKVVASEMLGASVSNDNRIEFNNNHYDNRTTIDVSVNNGERQSQAIERGSAHSRDQRKRPVTEMHRSEPARQPLADSRYKPAHERENEELGARDAYASAPSSADSGHVRSGGSAGTWDAVRRVARNIPDASEQLNMRTGTPIQVAYDDANGIDLPIHFWAASGARSPPETKLPRKTDARTNLTINQTDDEIEYAFNTRYSNGNQLQPQKLATHFQFYGRKSAAEPEPKLLHQATYSMLVGAPSGLGGAKFELDGGSGSFKLDGYYLSGVRLFHQHKGTLDPIDYARSEFKRWKDEIARE